MTLKIALAMTIKGNYAESEKLDKALKSITPYIDSIYITITSPREFENSRAVATKYHANISHQQFTKQITQPNLDKLQTQLGYSPFITPNDNVFIFDDAKNFTLSQIPKEYDWILWMDCDDVFQGGEYLKELVETCDKQNANVIYLNYLYHVLLDETGQVAQIITQSPRERLIKNGDFRWKGSIHEYLVPLKESKGLFNSQCSVVHLATEEDRKGSLMRNVKSLEYAISQYPENSSNIYYLAKSLYDMRQLETDKISKQLILKYIPLSKWSEEKAQAWGYLADLSLRNNNSDEAITYLMKGLTEEPMYKELYLKLAETYVVKEKWERAMFWLNLMKSVPERMGFLASTPAITGARTLGATEICKEKLAIGKTLASGRVLIGY